MTKDITTQDVTEVKSSGGMFSFDRATPSAAAKSLTYALEATQLALDLRRASYDMEGESATVWGDLTKRNADLTRESGKHDAKATMCQAFGAMGGGLIQIGGVAGGTYKSNKLDKPELTEKVQTLGGKQKLLQDEKPDLQGVNAGNGVSGATTPEKAKAAFLANANDKNYEATADVRRIASNDEVRGQAQAEIDSRCKEARTERQSLDSKMGEEFNRWSMGARGVGDLVSGALQSGSATEKTKQAEDDASRAAVSGQIQALQGAVDNLNKAIDLEAQQQQAISAMRAEMVNSNKV